MRIARAIFAATLSVALLLGAAIGVAPAATASQAGTGVCEEFDSGKIDVSGSHKTLTLTAPAGKLIDGYCVKAGSANQGNGPEWVAVDPPQKSVTISHSTGKDISHYALRYIDIPKTPAPQQSLTCTGVTVDYKRALKNGDHINLEYTVGGVKRQVNAYVDLNVTGGFQTLGLRFSDGTALALTEEQVSSGIISWQYPALIASGSFSVTFLQTNETDTWPNLQCDPPVVDECAEGLTATTGPGGELVCTPPVGDRCDEGEVESRGPNGELICTPVVGDECDEDEIESRGPNGELICTPVVGDKCDEDEVESRGPNGELICTPPVDEECKEGHVASIGDDGKLVCDEPVVDLGIVKSHSELEEGTVEDEDTFAYFLAVTNHGNVAVTDAEISDEIPASLVVLAVSTPVGTIAGTGNEVRITGVSLAPGASAIVAVTVQVVPAEIDAASVVYPGEDDPEQSKLRGPIVNEACVSLADGIADEDDSNDCSSVTIERDEIVATVFARCINDAPYLYYSVETSPSLAEEPITLTWTPNTPGADPAQVTRTLESGDSDRILWPGAAFAPNGNSVLWPGYRPLVESDYNADGTLAVDPALVYNGLVLDPAHGTYPWRFGTSVTLEVNPSITIQADYPPQTVNCAVPRSAAMTVTKTASADYVHPGESFDYALAVANVSVDSAADPVVITDVIPADLRVDEVVTDSSAFPRWRDCDVTGADDRGYGGILECTLFGPLAVGQSAPVITLGVTLDDTDDYGDLSNTAEVCWGSADSAGEIVACDDDTVTIGVGDEDLAVTGSVLSGGVIGLGALALGAGVFLTLLSARRRAQA